MARVGIILVCTRKYDVFLQQFIDSVEKLFFQGEQVDVYLLTDKPNLPQKRSDRIDISVCAIPSYSFPWATLFRYKEITEYSMYLTAEHLFYSDIDMRFVAPVGEEILCDGITAVRHPGFYHNNGWGSTHTHPQSLAYLKPELRHEYYCGGFQGGRRTEYLNACSLLSEMIDIDLDTAKSIGYTDNHGILAQWHDETMWNWYCKLNTPKKVLSPEYCMVEQKELRLKWGIDNLTPKLIALSKDHKQIRS